MDKKDKHWLIVFEDAERESILFTDEDAALKAYQGFLVSWNCHLFEQVRHNGKVV